jgi:uncharacterized protein
MKNKQRMLIPTIYVDLDDVIAETLRTFAQLANVMYRKHIQFDEIHSFDLGKSFDLSPSELKVFMHAAHSRDVLSRILPNLEAKAALSEWVAEGTHLTVVTGRPISTYDDTLEWLRAHKIPFHALRFLRKYGKNDLEETLMRPLDIRTLPHATFLFSVEDSPKMANYLATRVKVPVLFLDKPWNKNAGEIDHSLIMRCHDWKTVRARAKTILRSSRFRHAG